MSTDDRKQTSEESKVQIFRTSKYKIGTDHTAWNRAYARDVARQLGIGDDEISDSAIDHMMSNVGQLIRDVLMKAAHFCSHGRRTKVETCDVENSINILGLMLPFTSSHAASNTQFCLSDLLPRTLYPKNESMVDLRTIMNMPPRRMPLKRTIRKHWLVIDGVQPRVPENPVMTLPTSSSVQEGVTIYQNSSSDSLMEDGNRVPRTGNKIEQTMSRPITTHLLSVDQQVFFKNCVETVMGSCSEKRRVICNKYMALHVFLSREILHLLASDPGLQPLVPRFALVIFEGVRCNIAEQNLPVIRNILRLTKTLVDNPQVNLDKCLNDIVPSLCSCIVCREFSSDPEDKRHFRLREFAAMILATICKRTHLADVHARVTTFLCRIFTDSRANLASFYGALYALGELGCETVAVVLLPRLELLRTRITMLKDSSPTAYGDSEKVISLIEKMLTQFVMRGKMSGLSQLSDFQKAFPGFGEAVYKKINSEKQGDVVRLADEACQASSVDINSISAGGKIQNAALKRIPRIPQLPMRSPGVIRPTHIPVTKLRMFKHSKRHTGSGLFRQAPEATALQQPGPEAVQPISSSQSIQQNPNDVSQYVHGSSSQITGPLPAVVVEPAFPRRRPNTVGEPAKAHPAVTVEPAYPRRPSQPGAL